jgi:hypothetical protein
MRRGSEVDHHSLGYCEPEGLPRACFPLVHPDWNEFRSSWFAVHVEPSNLAFVLCDHGATGCGPVSSQCPLDAIIVMLKPVMCCPMRFSRIGDVGIIPQTDCSNLPSIDFS